MRPRLVAAGFCASQAPNQQLCCASSARSNTPAGVDFTSNTTAASPCTRISSRTDRKSTRLNSSHSQISYAVFCLKKKNKKTCRSGEHIPKCDNQHLICFSRWPCYRRLVSNLRLDSIVTPSSHTCYMKKSTIDTL